MKLQRIRGSLVNRISIFGQGRNYVGLKEFVIFRRETIITRSFIVWTCFKSSICLSSVGSSSNSSWDKKDQVFEDSCGVAWQNWVQYWTNVECISLMSKVSRYVKELFIFTILQEEHLGLRTSANNDPILLSHLNNLFCKESMPLFTWPCRKASISAFVEVYFSLFSGVGVKIYERYAAVSKCDNSFLLN